MKNVLIVLLIALIGIGVWLYYSGARSVDDVKKMISSSDQPPRVEALALKKQTPYVVKTDGRKDWKSEWQYDQAVSDLMYDNMLCMHLNDIILKNEYEEFSEAAAKAFNASEDELASHQSHHESITGLRDQMESAMELTNDLTRTTAEIVLMGGVEHVQEYREKCDGVEGRVQELSQATQPSDV